MIGDQVQESEGIGVHAFYAQTLVNEQSPYQGLRLEKRDPLSKVVNEQRFGNVRHLAEGEQSCGLHGACLTERTNRVIRLTCCRGELVAKLCTATKKLRRLLEGQDPSRRACKCETIELH